MSLALATPASDRDVSRAYDQHLSTGRARLGRLLGGMIEVRSAGARVYDAEGKAYLDCGGYGVFFLGHRPPTVVNAVHEQLDVHPLATNLLLEPRLAEAAARLVAVAPSPLSRVHFSGSGAEAVETAIKLARAHGKRHLIAMEGGYHGKTLGALSATPNPVYQDPFKPLLPAQYVPFGDSRALEHALHGRHDCCVVVEPVQGEGGVVIPPLGYLADIRDACRAHDALLIVDEIQTGLGRLGAWWGVNQDDVVPDVLLAGKALSGGVVPVAATLATAETFDPFNRDPVLHTSTFSGAPLAMAAAAAALRTIEEQNLVERAARLGELLLEGARQILLPDFADIVVDVRGRGLLIGIQACDPGIVAQMAIELLERGVIANHSLNANSVLRLTPPAVLDDNDLALLFAALEDAARAITRAQPGGHGRA